MKQRILWAGHSSRTTPVAPRTVQINGTEMSAVLGSSASYAKLVAILHQTLSKTIFNIVHTVAHSVTREVGFHETWYWYNILPGLMRDVL